ncbi:MAG: hypothetical protein ACYCZY_04360 [Lacisediminihabitans sp.]
MSLLNAVVEAAAETHLIAPTWVFPILAAAVFISLGFVIWSFRDVANRHSQKFTRARTDGTEHH